MTAKKTACLIIGDVLLDVFIGDKNENPPFLRGGTSYFNSGKIEFGGGGNVAMALSILGAKPGFLGKAGDDVWGRAYAEDLNQKNVETQIFFEKGASTGFSLVATGKNGERSFQVFRGANDKLSIDEIDKKVNLIRDSEYLFFSGYSLVESPQKDAIFHAVSLAKDNQVKVIFDPGAHNLVRSNFRFFNKIKDLSDVFCPNIDEAKAITKTGTLDAAVQKLKERKELTAIKCGADGCLLVKQEDCIRIPTFKSNCEDTTGAGDAFDAAIIFGLVNNLSLEDMGQLANWFAKKVVQNIGARSFPAKKEINAFLKQMLRNVSRLKLLQK